MKKFWALLLSVICCLCFAGCNAVNQLLNEILSWGATVPPSSMPVATFYGVVQTLEDSDDLFVYIDGTGVCEIPSYKETLDVEEGDMLRIEFHNVIEVPIMECYPARFSLSADRMVAMEFDFSLSWGINGISSYDSKTGRLVKTDDVVDKENYETTHILTPQEKLQIFKIVQELNVYSYPDEYNPTEGKGSSPDETLILSVNFGEDDLPKTITARNVALDDATDWDGQRFMDACDAIENILENTEEWKALPDYPYLYD